METVELAGRTVRRLGMSLAGLRTTGMWGEPASRPASVAALRLAVELGVDLIEVPMPFGPAADLAREGAGARTMIAVRLTERVRDAEVLSGRLGRPPDLILADEHLLEDMREWGIPLGAVVVGRTMSARFQPLSAVRGPYPALRRLVEWCEGEGVPLLAPSVNILAAGQLTIAVPAPQNTAEVERLYGEGAATPPGAAPG